MALRTLSPTWLARLISLSFSAGSMSGFFASKAGLPGAAARLRALQLRQLRAALPWAALELDLPPPDGNCV